jgi:hypothetical protein
MAAKQGSNTPLFMPTRRILSNRGGAQMPPAPSAQPAPIESIIVANIRMSWSRFLGPRFLYDSLEIQHKFDL